MLPQRSMILNTYRQFIPSHNAIVWIMNFETGLVTPVTLHKVVSATCKALDAFFGIQKSNAFVFLS